ncbi:MAG TPA: transporter substrate-binding domain-containing protein [Azospirillaceae bacterium]|nr:transporter substrate-binding domain-containing protein [Azospirillaceae bacterium]
MRSSVFLRRALAALALLLGTLVPVTGARAEVWLIASQDNFPPYNYTLKGKRTGLDAEIVDTVLKRIGALPVHQAVNWLEVVESLEKDKIDLAFQFVARPDRFEKFHMIGPVRTGETVLMARADSDITFDTLEDLKGVPIGYIQGFSYTPEFDAAEYLEKVPASGELSNIRRLVMGRVDLVIGDLHTLTYFADQEAKLAKVKILPKTLGLIPRYFAIPKSRAEKARRFQAAFEEIRSDGTLDEIITRWRTKQP